MTDNDIIKALECCADLFDCTDCPCKEFCGDLGKLQQNALDLINRQQETIETLRGCIERHHIIRKDGKSPLSLLTAEIRAEAIKECIEKVREKLDDCRTVTDYVYQGYDTGDIRDMLDNLLKEMVGK